MQNKSEDCVIEMRHITKTFPGTKALDDVHLKLRRGEVPCTDRRERGREEHADEHIDGAVYPR